jgi:tRNA threonylcarbamoyladenosine biosynthesis protein TsaB
LISDVEALLEDAGVGLSEVDAFAVDIGPGSFTGVRIGVTTAKTWADLLDKPLVGVSALEAIAFGYSGLGFDLVVPTIRARPGAFYVAGFSGSDGGEELPAGMATSEDITALVRGWKGKAVLFCGDGWTPFEEVLRQAAVEREVTLTFKRAEPLRAGTFADIAMTKYQVGVESHPIDLVPLYIASPPIGPKAQRSRASSNQ